MENTALAVLGGKFVNNGVLHVIARLVGDLKYNAPSELVRFSVAACVFGEVELAHFAIEVIELLQDVTGWDCSF